MKNVQPKDPKDTSVSVGVNSVLREGHNVRPILHVYPVLAAP